MYNIGGKQSRLILFLFFRKMTIAEKKIPDIVNRFSHRFLLVCMRAFLALRIIFLNL